MHLLVNYFRFLPVLIIFQIAFVHEQMIAQIETNIIEPFSFSKIGVAEWSSGGIGSVNVGSSTAALSNPALLRANSFSVYAEVGKRSETAYIYEFKLDGQYLLPNYTSISTSFDEFTFALSYANMFNKYLHVQFPITTVDHPDGTGEFYDVKSKDIIRTILLSASYNFENIISIGFSTGINIATSRDEIFHSEAYGSGLGEIIVVGIYCNPVNLFHVGSSIQLAGNISSTTKMAGKDLLVLIDQYPTTSGNNRTLEAKFPSNEFPFTAKFPFSIKTGVKWDVSTTLSIMSEVQYSEWSTVSSNYDNVVDGHLGMSFEIIENIKIRAGYFSQTDPTKPSRATNFSQKFWTSGIECTIFPGTTITAGLIQNFKTESKTLYGTFPNDFFQQDAYLIGLLYQL